MKVISLNAWGGKAGTDGLVAFAHKYRETDVLCFQEVFDGGEEFRGMKAARFTLDDFDSRLLHRISEVLPDHVAYFRPHFENIFGLVVFVRKEYAVTEEGEASIYKEKGYYSKENIADQNRILQYVTLANPVCSIIHTHGLWNGKGKHDSQDRLTQSDRILEFTGKLSTPYVLLGDFNLRPETESIKKLEYAGMRNLISEFGITTTRTALYDQRDVEPHANYAFVSKDIRVQEFKVLPDEVSDHAPLYLDFEIV